MKSGKITLHVIDDPQNADTDGGPDDRHCGDACMTQPILEPALRRAAFWARRGMPHTAAELLAGTDGLLHVPPRARRPRREAPRRRGGSRPAEPRTPARHDHPHRRRLRARRLGRPAVASGRARRVSADTSSLADALALAFGHGPLAGTKPAFIATRDGVTFTRRISWAFDGGGSVSIDARAGTLGRLRRKDRQPHPAALARARGGRRVALTVKVAGWLVFDRRVVDGDGNLCAITTWGQTRAECRGLRRWSEREGRRRRR